jgi:hypothetical protein
MHQTDGGLSRNTRPGRLINWVWSVFIKHLHTTDMLMINASFIPSIIETSGILLPEFISSISFNLTHKNREEISCF